MKIGDGFVLPTDRQTQDYLLCQDCEETLNQGGETWIADKLATWERSFPLHGIVIKQPPAFDEGGGMTVYFVAKNPEIKVDKLTHFALGMFWKASVHSWSGTRTDPRIDLGPYSEEIRRWLRGEGEFPKYVYLVAIIASPLRAQITLNDPYEGVRQGWRTFFVHVPGLLFMLSVGKTVDETMRAFCIHNNPACPIGVSDALMGQVEQMMVDAFHRAYKTEAYLKAKTKADKERTRTRSGVG